MRRWRISFTAFHKVAHGLLEKEVSQGSLIQFYRSVLNSFLSENRKILRFFWWIWSELAHFCCRVFQWNLGLLGERSGVKSIFFGLQHAKSLQRTPQGGVVVGRIGCLTQLRFRGVFARRKQKYRKNNKKCNVDIFFYKVGLSSPYSFYYQYVMPIGVSFHCLHI